MAKFDKIMSTITSGMIDDGYARFADDELAKAYIIDTKNWLVEELKTASSGHDMVQAICTALCSAMVSGYVIGHFEGMKEAFIKIAGDEDE